MGIVQYKYYFPLENFIDFQKQIRQILQMF